MKKFKQKNWIKTGALFILLAAIFSVDYLSTEYFLPKNKSVAQVQQQQKKSTDIPSIAWITDIHADKEAKRDDNGNVIYPSNYKKCLEQVLALKTDLVIATGDNVDKAIKGFDYYQELKSITKGRNFIWVKGNHDQDGFKILADNNYFVDYKNWRIVVLDSAEQFKRSTGYLDDSQISFLKDSINIDKNIIVAMHHPPFFYNSRANIYTRDKIPLYENFFNALTPNVKYVLTGHWHHEIGAEINGIQFLTEKALTQDEQCNYKIINLPK